jgi:hypothetical protein
MAAITAGAVPQDAHIRTRMRRRDRMRAALAAAARKGTAMVSAARHREWSPALTISALAFLDTAAWSTYGHGAGYAAIGLSILIFDWQRDQ